MGIPEANKLNPQRISLCAMPLWLNSGSYQARRLCMKREADVLHYQNLIRKAYTIAHAQYFEVAGVYNLSLEQ